MPEHVDITDPEIHEPKGAATASEGSVYVSDGDGSGSWSILEPANADLQQAKKVYVSNGSGGTWEFIPNGWGYYKDAEVTPTTLTINTTASKLQIDGGSVTSDTTHLPPEIRGSGNLWDVSSDKITPVAIGDSYVMRVSLSVTDDTGTPTYVAAQLDIGGDVTPTIVITDATIPVYKTPPYELSFSLPFFALETFNTNGGQIFLSTDTGSVTVSSRTILLTRTSSGGL